jgi:hypothetical protein
MLKSKSKSTPTRFLILTLNILTAFIRLGRAGPVRGRVPSNPVWFGPGALHNKFSSGITIIARKE